MNKRYQVFVSSTFEDLQEERKEVMQALLELDCIPSGMELFPASNNDQWSLIKKVIDDSDYYLLIVGGRYGSVNDRGVSYTQMEFGYALEIGKPIISFLPKDPDTIINKKCEKSEEGKKKLEEFKKLVQKKMVKYWSTPQELGSIVSRSLIKLIKDFPAIGWVRADRLLDEGSTLEILNLRKQIDILEKKLLEIRTSAPGGTENLAQGEDLYEFEFTYKATKKDRTFKNQRATFKITWDEMFSLISPLMINEAAESDLKSVINSIIKSRADVILESSTTMQDPKIIQTYFHTLLVQFKALGLIIQSKKNKSVKDTETYWTLTPYGDTIMTKLRAIKK
jgi:plasmid replication initiation protein